MTEGETLKNNVSATAFGSFSDTKVFSSFVFGNHLFFCSYCQTLASKKQLEAEDLYKLNEAPVARARLS